MVLIRLTLLVALAGALSGCVKTGSFTHRTESEQHSGYTYVPLDPFPVYFATGFTAMADADQPAMKALSPVQTLQLLPDNAVRMSVEAFDAKGNVTYGPAAMGASGMVYRITVDYINADAVSLPIAIRKLPPVNPGDPPVFEVWRHDVETKLSDPDATVYNIPIYVGIGLRVTADVRVMSAKAVISGLGVLGAEAEANRIVGNLVVQTLGVNGKSISAALPIQSELNRTTAQNAVVAVGSIKALLYEADTVVVPRVVGMYLPFPADKKVINAIISEISREPVKWHPPTRPQGVDYEAVREVIREDPALPTPRQ
jgi:hypothetical protein